MDFLKRTSHPYLTVDGDPNPDLPPAVVATASESRTVPIIDTLTVGGITFRGSMTHERIGSCIVYAVTTIAEGAAGTHIVLFHVPTGSWRYCTHIPFSRS